jgi:glycosyltransferase involved in cell wall biosynthesis
MEPDKLFVAYNALDTDIQFFLKQTLRDLDCFRNKHGLENKKVIIFAGRLVPEKRADHVIRAMKKVIQTVPDAHLIVVGDGPERKKLEYLVEEIGVKNCCSLIGEIYNEEILARYFLISRAAVMPAYAGLAIQHAFAYAVPVILGDIRDSHGPEAKLVVNGGTGLYFKDSDINGLAAAIMEILENDSLYQHLSHNAFQVITEKHNKQKMADGIIQAIRWALK